MKKRFMGIVLVVLLSLFMVGCDTNNNKYVDDGKDEKVSRTPTYEEIASVVQGKGASVSTMYTILVAKLTEAISKVNFSDVVGYVTGIQNIYGDYTIPSGSVVYDSIVDMALLDSYSYVDSNAGPIVIIKGVTLIENGTSKKINLVALCGTACGGIKDEEGNAADQATGLIEDLYSGMGLTNEYVYDAYYAIYDALKGDESTPIVITGISLGGMVAQQLAALPALTEYFTISNVVAIASPIVQPDGIDYTKTTVRRIVDTVDAVPALSTEAGDITTNNYVYSAYPLNAATVITSSYKSFIGSHTLAYVNYDLWEDVDVLGVKGGDARIVFNKTNLSSFDAAKYDAAKEAK